MDTFWMDGGPAWNKLCDGTWASLFEILFEKTFGGAKTAALRHSRSHAKPL